METVPNPFEETEQKPANLPLMVDVLPRIPEVLPQPVASGAEAAGERIAKAGQPYRITAANARILQQKSLEARRLKNLVQQPQPQPVIVAVDPITLRVQRINQRIEAILDELEESTTAKDTQALCMSLDRLYGVWSLLTGHPRPGVRKTDAKRGRSTFAQPME